MKSVVLCCAGIGSRLGLAQTKALLTIEGKTVIEWQLEALREVEDLRIVVGFQAQDVVTEVLKHRKDVLFVYNHSYFENKTAASFYFGARDAYPLVIQWDGDLLIHPDDVRLCLEAEGEYIAYSDISSDDAVFVRTNAAGEVLSFSRTCGDYEWTGPACIRRDDLKFSSEHVYNQLEPKLPMRGLKIRACDIDTYEDYLRATEFVLSWK